MYEDNSISLRTLKCHSTNALTIGSTLKKYINSIERVHIFEYYDIVGVILLTAHFFGISKIFNLLMVLILANYV